MVKFFWAAVAVSFIVFVVVALQISVGPRPIQVIKISAAKEPAEIGFWIYRQLRPDVFKHKVILWGFQNERVDAETARGFWESARNDGQEIDLLIRPAGLKMPLPIRSNEYSEVSETARLLPQLIPTAKKILVFLPSQDASHIVKDSLVHKFEESLAAEVMSVSALDWSPNHPAEKFVEEHCEDAKNLTGFPDFNFFRCIYRGRKAKIEKMKTPEKQVFLLDQYGVSDYLVLIYP